MASGKPLHAFWLFFPTAASWAAMVVPLSLYAVLSGSGWPPGLIDGGHGHELIFGFALALIAGYTLGPQPWRILGLLFILWLAARVSWLLAPDTVTAQLLSPAFALLLAWHVVPRFQAAKKWRNKIAGPLILVLCLLAVAFWLVQLGLPWPERDRLMHAAILGLLLLMTFMGGRIIAPAVAGTLEKRGIALEARVQPRIEGALLVLLILAMALLLVTPFRDLTGSVLLVCALLITLRVARWKLWHCRQRADLLVLAFGYLWLGVGAALAAGHLLTGKELLPALHVITIGALGTLSCSVMLRLAWQRAHRTFPPNWQVWSVAGAMLVAVSARYLAGGSPWSHPGLLWLAAGAWSLCYLGVCWQLLRLFRADRRRRVRSQASV